MERIKIVLPILAVLTSALGFKVTVKSETERIPLTLCCPDGDLYRIGLDVCRELLMKSDSEVDPFPPVYSVKDNQTVVVEADRFQLNRNLSVCPDGYVGKSSTTFKFYDDGTLLIPQGTFQSGEFCISRVPKQESVEFAARFCVPDPCHRTKCLRKCCPQGSVVNLTVKMCQPSDIPFNVSFHNESGDIVQPESSLVLRDGASPHCSHGINAYHPVENQEDEFYLLSNGRMYIPAEERAIQEYCIDYFLEEDSLTLQALVCFPPPSREAQNDQLALAIFPYFFFSSTVFLMATFFVYAVIPELRNIHGVTIMSYVASMTVAYIGLGNIQMSRDYHNKFTCQGLAVVTHFTFLAIFSWLNVVSFDIWWNFRTMRPAISRTKRRRLGLTFILYSLYGWGVPLVIVVVGQILDNMRNLPVVIVKPNFGLHKCWFGSRESLLAYLYGPVAVLILSNIVFFIMTAFSLYQASVDTAMAAGSHHEKQRFRVIFSLFLLMGVSWLTEIISYAVGGDAYNWFFTDIINILTGVYVFVIFVCKPKVWKLLKLKFPCLERLSHRCQRLHRHLFPMKVRSTPAVSRTTSDSNQNKTSLSRETSLGTINL